MKVFRDHQSFGNDGSILNNISYNHYMQSFFSRVFQPEPKGTKMLSKIQEEYNAGFDTYSKVKKIKDDIDELTGKVTTQARKILGPSK
mmetsp:Transcript_25383/g.47382  ORF Transcript_25383/g.47382 Transcript_25383/m.47382 type:complete len:88 (+) Transcript_25383:2-265(+)